MFRDCERTRSARVRRSANMHAAKHGAARKPTVQTVND